MRCDGPAGEPPRAQERGAHERVGGAAPVSAQVASLELAPTAHSSSLGRRFVTDALTDWGLLDLLDAAELLTSELVTNAVLHARTAIVVSVTRDSPDGVTVRVRDGSPVRPQLRRHSADSTTGRGVQLLRQLASSWDVTVDAGGKTVAFSLVVGVDPWAAYAGGWEAEL